MIVSMILMAYLVTCATDNALRLLLLEHCSDIWDLSIAFEI